MAATLLFGVLLVAGFVAAAATRRDRLQAMLPFAGRVVSIFGVLAAFGMLMIFFDAAIAGLVLGFCTAMAHGAAGTILGIWLRRSTDRQERLAVQAVRMVDDGLAARSGLAAATPDEALFSKYGRGSFILWSCLSALLGPLIMFMGAARTGFRGTDIVAELVVLAVALAASGTLVGFGLGLWRARLAREAEAQPLSGI